MVLLKSSGMRTYSLNNDTSNLVRVSVGGRSSVLEVTLAILGALAGNTDGTTTVSDTVGELVNGTSLVATGKTSLVTLTVDGNVLNVTGLELLHGSLNGLHTTLSTGGVGGDVSVKTGTVPVTGNGLRMERDLSTEFFGDTVEEETRHPKVVAHLDTLARTDLVLPLSGHDLGVDAGDVDTGVQAGLVVSLNDVTAVDLAGSDTAVVRALGTGETTLGPAVWPSVGAKEGVFLLKTEPEVLAGVSLHQLGSFVAVVELVGGSIGVPGLTEDKDVLSLAEGVREDSNGANVDIGVVTGGLAGGGTVEVPLRELVDGGDSLGESLE